MSLDLTPIGIIRSAIKDRKQVPPFGAAAAVEIYPQFSPGLHFIEKHTHFWILAWLDHRNERDVLQVIPRYGDTLHGVFAVRSPARPNPIGLTAARLLHRDQLTLHFDALDFMDGTEVLDIKPYFASRDLIFNANGLAVGRAKDRESVRESLRFQAMRYVSRDHPDVERAIDIAAHFRIEVCDWIEPDSYELQVPVNRPYLADALIGITRVTLSRGLAISSNDEVVLNNHRYSCSGDQLYIGRR